MLSHLRTTWGLAAGVFAGLVLLFLVGLALVRPQPETGPRTTPADPQNDEALDQARDILAKANHAAACRSGLQQLNVRLSHHPERRPDPLTEEQRQRLHDQFGFGPDELAEVEGAPFTQLDAHHVEVCFLLHDVVRSLDVSGLSQPEQAAAAFAWVMRQVRPVERDEDLLAPEFVLHCGWGTARQRALLFVNLLDQLGIPGCVLAAGDEKEPLHPWACGALTTLPGGTKDVLLFDPRLGLPLPGPKAATPELAAAFRLALPVPGTEDRQPVSLATLRRQPDLLDALTADDKHSYDVTRGQLEGSHIYLVGMLSALAPRMKYLEEDLPAVRAGVRLACDPSAALATWKGMAAGLGGTPPEVRFWKEAARAEIAFWPPEEGGNDRAGRQRLRLRDLIVRQALPPQLDELEGEPGNRIQAVFQGAFLSDVLLPDKPPDLLLHGQFDDAARALVQSRDQLREEKGRLAAAVGLDEKIGTWRHAIYEAQANVSRAQRAAARDSAAHGALDDARAQLDHVWKEGEEALSILLQGRIAEVQLPDVTYLLALCKQEQAERLELQLQQARRSGRSVSEADTQAAREAWADASSWWDQYAGDLAATAAGLAQLPRRSGPAAARLLHARAHQALGERDQAERLLRDPTGLTGLEQTARLYLARQLKKP
jgi:hypothetical protein